ncbi:MAG TPA: hypothetical protein VGJ07_18370 [Rugosimonospora sp.]
MAADRQPRLPGTPVIGYPAGRGPATAVAAPGGSGRTAGPGGAGAQPANAARVRFENSRDLMRVVADTAPHDSAAAQALRTAHASLRGRPARTAQRLPNSARCATASMFWKLCW